MVAPIQIGGSIEIGGGISIGQQSSSSFILSSSDFTTIQFGTGPSGNTSGFNISGSYGSGQAVVQILLGTAQGGNPTKATEIYNFWQSNGLTLGTSAYMFNVAWGPGSSTNTNPDAVLLALYYIDTDNIQFEIGTVDTNIPGWNTSGQDMYSTIRAANGIFNFPATFTLITPNIVNSSNWC